MRGQRQGQMIHGFHDAVPLYDYSGLAVETSGFGGLAVDLGALDNIVDDAWGKLSGLPTLAKAGALVLLGFGGYAAVKHFGKGKAKVRSNGRRSRRKSRKARRNRR